MSLLFILLLAPQLLAVDGFIRLELRQVQQIPRKLLAASVSSPSFLTNAPNITSSAPSSSSTKQTSSSPTKNQRRRRRSQHIADNVEQQISRLGRRGKTDMALEIFYTIESPTLRAVNTAIDACARARPVPRIETAYAIYDSMQIRPNVYTFGSLLNAIRRLGDIDAALQLLSDMQDIHGIVPNAVIYQSIIATAATAARPDIAVGFLQHNVTVIGYNAALSACAKAKQYELALEVFHNMTIPKDAITYGTVMAACEAAEQWELVLELAEEYPDIDCLGLTSALHACQNLAYGNRALEILDRMKDLQESQGVSTSRSYKGSDRRTLKGPDRVAYRLAISACGKAGMWSDGISLLKEYNELFGADATAYTAAMTGLECAGEYEVAFRLLARMRQADIVPTISTFVAIIGACANACSANPENHVPKEKALQLLSVMRKDHSVVLPTLPVYNAVIRVCAEGLDLSTAFRVYELLLTDDHMPSIVTFGTLMTACERSNSLKGMKRVFQLLSEASIRPNEIVYGAAISCCRKNGASKYAYAFYENMQEEGLNPNTVTVNTVLAALTASGRPDDMDTALSVFESMESPNRQTYGILIRSLTTAKRAADAEDLICRMRTSMIPDVDLYTSTITAYERLGQPLKALRLMESMREEGYDFYEAGVLNTAFKSAVRLASALDQRLSDDDRRLASSTGMNDASARRDNED